MRVLIVGGYGVFGGRLARLLAGTPDLTLVIAGRSAAKAAAFCFDLSSRLDLQAGLEPSVFDRDGNLAEQLAGLRPDLVVDATGPFQDYSGDPHALADAAITAGVDYADFADGAEFVAGIAVLDDRAKKRGVFVLSGVSSFPVLTAAVVRSLAAGLDRVEVITGGIAPSPYAGVGLNVIRAVASYAGKPVRLIRGGQPALGRGLVEKVRFTVAPPGGLPLHNTLFSLVDVPDLTVLPPLWPGVRSIWIGAGPVPEILHRALNALAWCVASGFLPTIAPLAPLFHRVMNTIRWGEHRGGMFVRVEGVLPDGASVSRTWHMLAEGDDGPLIPAMAIEAVVRNCLAGRRPASGVRTAIGDIGLADYERLFASRAISTGVREECAGKCASPLYARILGHAWDDLPPSIRAMHGFQDSITASGNAQVERGSHPVSRLMGWLLGFPPARCSVPVRVRLSARQGKERWERTFGTHTFSSEQSEGVGRNEWLCVERFGPVAVGLALVVDGGRLRVIVRRCTLIGVPLPNWLAPYGESHIREESGRYHFDVEVRHPFAGLIVRYRGELAPD